jgi:hypothetical protein
MWSGKDTQEFPKWEPPGHGRPKYKVPAGVRCAVRDIRGNEWIPYTTTKESGFERYERYESGDDGKYYEFRLGAWLLLVHRRYVVHRETVDELEKRLRMWPRPEPKKRRRR